jgi:hypothetical protein
MSYFRRSRFAFGDTAWTMELSARPWIPGDSTLGGSRTAAAGVPASSVVRRDSLIKLTLRFEEYEWPNVHALIRYGQTAQAFQWFPDADDTGDTVFVYLDAPVVGERFAPTRMAEYERGMEITLTLRELPGATTWRNYFEEE